MYGYIYKTTNLITGKIYIGRHKAIQFEPHKYIGSGVILRRAIEKYGRENFNCELIEIADDRNSLNEKEKYWIKRYRETCAEQLYNITAGGEAEFDGIKKIIRNDESKFILVEDLDKYLAEGWTVSVNEKIKQWKAANKESIRKYQKKWKQKNPDKVRERKKQYLKTHPEKNRAAQKRYLEKEENKNKHRERVKKNYHEKIDQKREYYRAYFQNPEAKARHIEAQRRYREKLKKEKEGKS